MALRAVRDQWDALSPRTKRLAILGALIGGVLIGSVLVVELSGPPKKIVTASDKRVDTTVLNPAAQDNTLENVMATIRNLQSQIGQLQNGQVVLNTQVAGAVSNMTNRVNELATGQRLEDTVSRTVERVAQNVVDDAIKKGRITATAPAPIAPSLPVAGKTSNGVAPTPFGISPTVVDLSAPLPGATRGGEVGEGSAGGAGSASKGRASALRVVDESQAATKAGSDGAPSAGASGGGAGAANSAGTPSGSNVRTNEIARDRVDSGQGKGQSVFLPAGSVVHGLLLTGLDAPTSSAAVRTPTPALVRIKKEAILPNLYRADFRECFLLISGYGQMSTERAVLRTELLSCIREDGGAVEVKLNGYVVGEDGKVGMRGRLVSKQGAIMAKALVAGVLSGIGRALTPISVVPLNTNATGGTLASQMPDMGSVLESGAANGVSTAFNSVAKFYLDAAKEMFPVVEIDAGRTVEVVITNGASIKFVQG